MADSTASSIPVNNQNFVEKVLQAPQMVVVNFFSDRSNSCQIFEPEFAAIGQEYQGRVTFARVDVDSNEELTNQQKVDGIPTLLFFKNGQEIHRIKGIVMRDKLRRQVEGALLVSSHPNSGETA
ncbi:MAG TPA: thioredoxin domain-containing protein [Ktedonobacteraceae bacterium]|nr:thioredoxin domain-containing protein [Ktedonobacteraceae bacterium]